MLALAFQGVTLTDLQEAEKTIGRSRPTKTREEEKEEKEKQDKEKQEEKKETETKEDDYRSKYRFEEVHLWGGKKGSVQFLFAFLNWPLLPPPSALPALVFLRHLHHFYIQHCLHPVLLQHRSLIQLPQQTQQSDGDYLLLQPILQR